MMQKCKTNWDKVEDPRGRKAGATFFSCLTAPERFWPKKRKIKYTSGLEFRPKLRTVLSLNFVEVFLKGGWVYGLPGN